ETITGVLAAGIKEGDLRQQISPRETALTLLGMIQFTALRCTALNCDMTGEAKKLWLNFLNMVR
ncbi:MAG: hypothetical protein WCI45_04965, partial [Desulfuromonadales bacterium]